MICLLLTYALRDLIAGFYGLGSGRNIGRGYIKGGSVEIKAPDGKTAKLIFENDVITVTDNDSLLKEWKEAR